MYFHTMLVCRWDYKSTVFLKSNMAIFINCISLNPIIPLLESKDNIVYLDKYLHINKFSAGLFVKTN